MLDGSGTFSGAAIRAAIVIVVAEVGLNVLRVSEDDFCAFLSAWTDWLDKSGVAEALTHQNQMAA
jgi:hypothetical protein